jgi:hypothetical protein
MCSAFEGILRPALRPPPEVDAWAPTVAALVVTNLGLVLLNRAQGKQFWVRLRRRNAALWLVTGGTAAMRAAILAIEPARQLFHFGALYADDVAIAIASGAVVLGLLAAVAHFDL